MPNKDTPLLRHFPSMAKRPCTDHLILNPSPSPRVSKFDHMDILLESFLGLSDSSPSLGLSFDRLLQSRASDSDQNDLIHRAFNLGSSLLEAAKRSSRNRSSTHNALVWALPPDLTIKVFSMLDTQSVCHAAATCSFFHKCAMDPLCYANIDLMTVVPKVNNVVVSTMIQRAGNVLHRSLKLGIAPGPIVSPGSSQPLVYNIRNSTDASGFSWNDKRSRQGKESSILTRSCLSFLSGDSGAPGALLRRLHLYNIERMDNASLCASLSACPSLLDLEIVGLLSTLVAFFNVNSDARKNQNLAEQNCKGSGKKEKLMRIECALGYVELRQTLESVSKHCRSIERLFFESSKTGRDDSLKFPTCSDLVNNCPHLTSLALRGFKLQDYKVRVLVKRNLGGSAGGNLLEVLMLRDCMHLKQVEVARLLTAILAGDYKVLRHLDISNREGLASEGDWYERCYSTSIIPVQQLLEERPGLYLLAEFPPEGSFCSFDVIEHLSGDDPHSDFSLPSQMSSHTSDGTSLFLSSSESSYNSDQSSGNEDGRDAGYLIYEESSDEVDLFAF
ncbi:unnamed protein product [Camellia sinensis]